MWIFILLGLGYFLFMLCLGFCISKFGRDKSDNRNFPSGTNVDYDHLETERQLKRQTDILERDRWDRLNNYKQGD